MFDQRTLLNFDIPNGRICKDEPCSRCGMNPPYHSWDCGMNDMQKAEWLELVRSTGPCGKIACGIILTETCRRCDNRLERLLPRVEGANN